jgi:hypothetical protein
VMLSDGRGGEFWRQISSPLSTSALSLHEPDHVTRESFRFMS